MKFKSFDEKDATVENWNEKNLIGGETEMWMTRPHPPTRCYINFPENIFPKNNCTDMPIGGMDFGYLRVIKGFDDLWWWKRTKFSYYLQQNKLAPSNICLKQKIYENNIVRARANVPRTNDVGANIVR